MNEDKIKEQAQKLTERCIQLATDLSFLSTLSASNNVWNQGKYQQIRVVGPMVEVFDAKTPDLYNGILNYLKAGEYRSDIIADDHSNYENPDYLRQFGKNDAFNLVPGRSATFLNRLIKSYATEAYLSDKEALNQVIYRLFYQTYKGVVYEHQTIALYQENFPMLSFEKTTPEMDAEYAVDYLIKKDGQLVAGLQIKPMSYQFARSQAHKEQIALNNQKNKTFYDAYGVKVAYAYYNDNIAALTNVLATQ